MYNNREIIEWITTEFIYDEGDCEGCTKDCIINGCKKPKLIVNSQNFITISDFGIGEKSYLK